ncbi:MAG: hypothetical protein JWM85_3095 [Acidimicrobiaceae bacterium]|nr:hypothetical protein [Acidimicrobiaceae bacterium]
MLPRNGLEVAELPKSEIDRSSPIPFYFQLAEILEQEITHQRWEAGARMPSESELCGHFELSRTTVRQALSRLEQEGLIRRQKGRGSFVAASQRRSWLLQSADGFYEDETGRLGRSVSSSILRLERAPLPSWASEALGLPRTEGINLERVRRIDGEVALFVENYLPLRFADALVSMTDPSESLYQRLKNKMGIEIAGARRTLEAIRAGERLGALLEVEPSAPVVAIHSVSWDANLRAVDCYRAWVRTDRLSIDIDVGTGPGPAQPPMSYPEEGRERPEAPDREPHGLGSFARSRD